LRKQLLCTSAIALGVAAAPATAQQWDLTWGGFYNTHVAISNTGGDATKGPDATDYDGLNTFVTGEIIFTPSVTLDNGLTFGFRTDLEAQNAGSMIDESFFILSGDTFGRLEIGGTNSAGYKLSVGAPEVTSMWINSPSISAFVPVSFAVPFNFRQAAISSYTEVAGNNDGTRINYFTPDFNGLTLGLSYAPTATEVARQAFDADGAIADRSTRPLKDIWDIGLYYGQSFGTTDVAFSARYGEGSATAAGAGDPSTWAVGLTVGFDALSIGGSYAKNDNDDGTFGLDQEGWSLGVSYDYAAWSFGLTTYQGKYDAPGSSDIAMYKLGASRDLGAGVSWDLYAIYVDADFVADPDPDGFRTGDVNGTVVGTAINLNF